MPNNSKKMDKFSAYYFLMTLILLLVFALQIYRFSYRWGLQSDDARDIMIAKEAISRREIPLFGSFSSAGPFVFGPLFYWYIIFCYLLFPSILQIPWVGMLIIGTLTVLILIHCGSLIGGRKLGLISGLLAAISPQMDYRSLALTQHTFINITTSLVLLNFLLFIKRGRPIFAFFMGLCIGIALNMHYQAINLLIFFPALFYISISYRKKILSLICMITGFILPSLPLLIWDFRQDWANFRNIFDYFLIGQYRIYVPNSWKLFIFNYFPNYWSFVIGGYRWLAMIIMLLLSIMSLYLLFKKRLSKPVLLLGVIFSILAIMNRYYRGERLEGYMIYFSPFIILFTAWLLNNLRKAAPALKILAFVLFCAILYGNSNVLGGLIVKYDNRIDDVMETVVKIKSIYPQTYFSLYDLGWYNSAVSYPLSIFLQENKMIRYDGHPIGVTCQDYGKSKILLKYADCNIIDLQNKLNVVGSEWANVNRSSVYDDLITQWTKNKLKSNFSFFK